jgi:hypothetical protein
VLSCDLYDVSGMLCVPPLPLQCHGSVRSVDVHAWSQCGGVKRFKVTARYDDLVLPIASPPKTTYYIY